MSEIDPFQRRVQALVDAAGGKKPLARRMGVTDSAINSWLAGSKPFESKLREACEHSGVSLAWLRDGKGRAVEEITKIGRSSHHRTPLDGVSYSDHSRIEEHSPHYEAEGFRTIIRVLADRLTSTQIAEALNEILAQKDIDESVRNVASQILVAAQLPKLKR